LPCAGFNHYHRTQTGGDEDRFDSFYTKFMVHILRPLPVARLKLLVFDLDGALSVMM
jgi:hypothetical protein